MNEFDSLVIEHDAAYDDLHRTWNESMPVDFCKTEKAEKRLERARRKIDNYRKSK